MMRFAHLTVGRKLAMMAATSTVLAIILAATAYQALSQFSGRWQNFREGPLQKIHLVSEGRSHLSDTIQNFKNYLLRQKDYDERFLADIAAVEKTAEAYAQLGAISAREEAALSSISEGVAFYRQAIAKAVEMKAAGASIETIDQSIEGADKPLKKAFGELMNAAGEESSEVSASVGRLVAMESRLLFAVSVLAVGLGSFLAWFNARSITRPLREAVRVAETVASGNLSSEIVVRTGDETGQLMQALKHMNDSLARIIQDVRTGASVISEASAQIASGNADLASRTEEQASSLEETASSMEQLTSNVKQNTDNARQANALAVAASDVAGKGGAVVSQVVGTMASISESSKKIVDIIAVIDGIAFQTNILALNAAVEAARAGEQGRGFAVVASEVRSLAQRSSAAAKEIKGLIGDSVDKVEAGGKLVQQAGATMEEIVDSVRRVTSIMTEITSASEEQGAGIQEINKAVAQMDDVAQQNSALVEEAASAAESLQNQANNLAQAVAVFKISDVVRSTPASRPAATVKAPQPALRLATA